MSKYEKSDTVKNLGCDVIRCSTHGFSPLWSGRYFCCKSKVPNSDFEFISKQEISEFEISVDDILLVNVLDSNHKLMHVVLNLEFCQFFSSLNKFVQCLVVAELQYDIHKLRVLEMVFELDDVRGLNLWVDFYLWCELRIIGKHTFSLAFDLVRVDLSIILTAPFLFVLRLITSWHTANPPWSYWIKYFS